METLKCAFNHPLIVGEFRCANARPVVHRGGPDIGCASEAAQRRCTRLVERIRAECLSAMGLEDDPLTLPHSVQVKIQGGGLLGLKRLLRETTSDDVAVMLDDAEARFQGIESVPVSQLVEDVTTHLVKRRRLR